MSTVKHDVLVKVPVREAYDQWTQFEEFPRFMEGVLEVRQLDPKRLFWRVDILGHEAEWHAEIDEQVPDERIEWHSTDGRQTRGIVRFEPWDMGETKVSLEMEYELSGLGEGLASALGLISSQVEGDLERFKEFIESRSTATGAWRGEIGDPGRDERAIAEQRQREPGPSAAPGGTGIVDERTGEIRNS